MRTRAQCANGDCAIVANDHGRESHGERCRNQHRCGKTGRQKGCIHRLSENQQGQFARMREDYPRTHGTHRVITGDSHRERGEHRFCEHEQREPRNGLQRRRRSCPQVHLHADRHKEQAQQHVAEGFKLCRDAMAQIAFPDSDSGQKCADRRRGAQPLRRVGRAKSEQ